ncbi:MAG: MAPEG family protein [Acetobacteraceae bacterium]|nr:MAPEG family protein [Acetobacteraceae bacterium]
MSPAPVTSLWAALCAAWLLWLSVAVIRQRLRARVAIGLGEDRLLLRACRAQGNFVEYAPLALLLILLLELGGTAAWFLHALGAALFLGRVVHALGISREPEQLRLRQAGMLLTFGVLALGAAALLARAL